MQGAARLCGQKACRFTSTAMNLNSSRRSSSRARVMADLLATPSSSLMRVVVTLTAKSLAVYGVLRSYEIINVLWPKKNHGKSQDVQELGVDYPSLKTCSRHHRHPLPPSWAGYVDKRQWLYSQRKRHKPQQEVEEAEITEQEESEEGAEDWGLEDLGCHTE